MADSSQVREITEKLEQGVKDLFSSEDFAAYLKTMSRFHNYSTRNTLLIHLQKPDASFVAGFQAWQTKFSRHVKKGEKAIKIFAPISFIKREEKEKIDPDTSLPVIGEDNMPVIEYTERKIARFKITNVFDIDQTDGKPLPSLTQDLTGNVEHYEAFIDALREVSPLPIVFEQMREDTDGECRYGDAIAIREGMSQIQTVNAVIHEITHAKLHDLESLRLADEDAEPKDRRTCEVESEGVSFCVCNYFSIDTGANSFGYVAEWSKGRELKELNASLDTIRKTAAEMIDAVESKFREIAKERGIDLTVNPPAAEQPETAQEMPPAEREAVREQLTALSLVETPDAKYEIAFNILVNTLCADKELLAVAATGAEWQKGTGRRAVFGEGRYEKLIDAFSLELADLLAEKPMADRLRNAVTGEVYRRLDDIAYNRFLLDEYAVIAKSGRLEIYETPYPEDSGNAGILVHLTERMPDGGVHDYGDIFGYDPEENRDHSINNYLSFKQFAALRESVFGKTESTVTLNYRETEPVGSTVLRRLLFTDGLFNREQKRTRVEILPPLGKYSVYAQHLSGVIGDDTFIHIGTDSGYLYPLGVSRARFDENFTESQIDRIFEQANAQQDAALSDPGKFASYQQAALTGRFSEVEAHNAVYKDIKAEKDRQLREELYAQKDAAEREARNKHIDQIKINAGIIADGGNFTIEKMPYSGKNNLLELFALYDIDVPLATKGWFNKKLVSFEASANGGFSYRSYKNKGRRTSYMGDTAFSKLAELRAAIQEAPALDKLIEKGLAEKPSPEPGQESSEPANENTIPGKEVSDMPFARDGIQTALDAFSEKHGFGKLTAEFYSDTHTKKEPQNIIIREGAEKHELLRGYLFEFSKGAKITGEHLAAYLQRRETSKAVSVVGHDELTLYDIDVIKARRDFQVREWQNKLGRDKDLPIPGAKNCAVGDTVLIYRPENKNCSYVKITGIDKKSVVLQDIANSFYTTKISLDRFKSEQGFIITEAKELDAKDNPASVNSEQTAKLTPDDKDFWRGEIAAFLASNNGKMELADLELPPTDSYGGLGKFSQVFGESKYKREFASIAARENTRRTGEPWVVFNYCEGGDYHPEFLRTPSAMRFAEADKFIRSHEPKVSAMLDGGYDKLDITVYIKREDNEVNSFDDRYDIGDGKNVSGLYNVFKAETDFYYSHPEIYGWKNTDENFAEEKKQSYADIEILKRAVTTEYPYVEVEKVIRNAEGDRLDQKIFNKGEILPFAEADSKIKSKEKEIRAQHMEKYGTPGDGDEELGLAVHFKLPGETEPGVFRVSYLLGDYDEERGGLLKHFEMGAHYYNLCVSNGDYGNVNAMLGGKTSDDAIRLAGEYTQIYETLRGSMAEQREKAVAEPQEKTAAADVTLSDSMPDPAVTIPDMNSYGYTGEGILPLNEARALQFYDSNITVYLLNPDNTELMAIDRSDIENHDGLFGIEQSDWIKTPEYAAREPAAASGEESREADLLYGNGNKFGIYQIRGDIDEKRDFRYAPLRELEALGLAANRANYELVYTAPLNERIEFLSDRYPVLNKIFDDFNAHQPADYAARSISVSDVIVMKYNGDIASFYVDSTGFKELDAFIGDETQWADAIKREQDRNGVTENPASDTLSQAGTRPEAYNGKTTAALEADVKAGKVISLTDLSKAVNAERNNGKARAGIPKAKKPTLMDRLAEGKRKAAAQGGQDSEPPRDSDKETRG